MKKTVKTLLNEWGMVNETGYKWLDQVLYKGTKWTVQRGQFNSKGDYVVDLVGIDPKSKWFDKELTEIDSRKVKLLKRFE